MRKLTDTLDEKLVPDWKRPWHYWSVIVLAVLGAFPDIYNLFVDSAGYAQVPEGAKWGIRGLVVLGYVARMCRQPGDRR